MHECAKISKIQSFVPMTLVCVGKKQWELMDKNNDNMEEQLEWDGNNGIANMVGIYIKHVDKACCDYFQSLDNCEKNAPKAHDESKGDEVTPHCSELRKWSHEKLSKAAVSMKKCDMQRVGDERRYARLENWSMCH